MHGTLLSDVELFHDSDTTSTSREHIYNYLSAPEGAIDEDALKKILLFLETGKTKTASGLFRCRLIGDDDYSDKEC